MTKHFFDSRMNPNGVSDNGTWPFHPTSVRVQMLKFFLGADWMLCSATTGGRSTNKTLLKLVNDGLIWLRVNGIQQ